MKYIMSISLLLVLCSLNADAQHVKKVGAIDFKNGIDSTNDIQLIDVRTPEEFKGGYLHGAMNLNFYDDDFLSSIALLDKSQPVYVYCKGGGRSALASAKLDSMGFTNIIDLDGGVMAWENRRFSMENRKKAAGANRFTQSDYEKLLNTHPSQLVVFYASWCIPCKKMEPSIAKLADKYAGKVAITRINVDEAIDVANALQIEGVPVLKIYKDKKLLKTVNEYQTEKQLEKLLNSTL